MSFTDGCLRHRSTVFFVTVAVLLAGASAYRDLPRESFPDITIPVIIVQTVYPGASPLEVETQVTNRIERELTGLSGLKELTSDSEESASIVTVEFVSGTDIDTALEKVRDRVDAAKPDLPEEAEDPVIQEINLSELPIIQVNLAGGVGPAVLKKLAEGLKDEIEAIPGVLRANLVGGLDREVKVEVDPERLAAYGLSFDDLVDAIRDENVSIPGGDIDVGTRTFAVRVPGEVKKPLAMADFVVEARQDRTIRLRDVARVSFGFEERRSYARIDGKESVAVAVEKRIGANVIVVADKVRAAVEAARPGFPHGVTATFLGDQSKDIRMMVKDLENNILSGLILVVFVLMFALGFRNAAFVGLAIPFSMLTAFVVIQLSGLTLNMIVLFSLVLAVGMLVDNGVVVVENVYRHLAEGASLMNAASEGTREVGMAVIFSTFTTVGAFLPLLFWPGVIGDFMSFLPKTVSTTLLASLLIALSLNPVLCATFLRERSGDSNKEKGLSERLGGTILDFYRKVLDAALAHRFLTMGGTLALFITVLALFFFFNQGVEFFPETEPRQIIVNVSTPVGTRLAVTDQIVREVERRLADLPDIRVMAAGSGVGSQADFAGAGGGGATKGRVTLDLLDREERSQDSFKTMAKARELTADITGAVIDVARPQEGPPVGAPVSIEFSGKDFRALGKAAGKIRETIADIPGLVSLDDDYQESRPTVLLHVDREEAGRLGFTTARIAGAVRTAVNGTKASSYRVGKDEYDVRVRLKAGARRSIEDLKRIRMVDDDGRLVPLSSLATIETTASLTSIKHKSRKRVVTVSGKVTNPKLAAPVLLEVKRRVLAHPDLVPAGCQLKFTGQNVDEEETKAFLGKAFLYGLLLVLGLMVGKFDSVIIPLIIMTSVAMSTIGVLGGLLIAGLPFGIVMTGLGVISLAGVVVNNAIVLLDYAEQLVERGHSRRDVVILSGVRRLRPVLLTAITTILGLIPLSTGIDFDFHTFHFTTGGESSQWWRSMGVAVIFGLGFATFLTLVLVPVLYDLLLGYRAWRKRGSSGAVPTEG